VIPRRLVVEQCAWDSSRLDPGEVTLDFRAAVVRHPQVELDLRINGPAQLVLPAGGSADLAGLRGPDGLPRPPFRSDHQRAGSTSSSAGRSSDVEPCASPIVVGRAGGRR
jgi:hypothetical protein